MKQDQPRHLRRAMLIFLAVLPLFAGCAITSLVELPPRLLRIEVQAGKFAEECFTLKAGERIEYQFQATQPLDFNLHTHRGSELVMPVDVKAARAQSGTFSSVLAEDFCMMWTNPGAVPAHIAGDWRRLSR